MLRRPSNSFERATSPLGKVKIMITALLQRFLLLITLVAAGLSWLAGGSASAQPADHGVQPWQAERAIRDFVNVFASQQVMTNDYSKIRVKISQVVPVYNKDVGWIYVAIFEGGVVPIPAGSNETQTYYHGILKIAADKSGVVHEAVVNEGQGLMPMTQKSSILQTDLPDHLGDWASWGGPPSNPGTASPTPTPTPQVTANPPPTPPSSGSSGPAPTKTQASIMGEFQTSKTAWENARKQNPAPANLPELFARFQKANADYMDMANNPGKYP